MLASTWSDHSGSTCPPTVQPPGESGCAVGCGSPGIRSVHCYLISGGWHLRGYINNPGRSHHDEDSWRAGFGKPKGLRCRNPSPQGLISCAASMHSGRRPHDQRVITARRLCPRPVAAGAEHRCGVFSNPVITASCMTQLTGHARTGPAVEGVSPAWC